MATESDYKVVIKDFDGNVLKDAKVTLSFSKTGVKRYLSPVDGSLPPIRPDPGFVSKYTNDDGVVDFRVKGSELTRQFYIIVSKPGYSPVKIRGTVQTNGTYNDFDILVPFAKGPPLNPKNPDLKTDSKVVIKAHDNRWMELHPKEIWISKLPTDPPGMTKSMIDIPASVLTEPAVPTAAPLDDPAYFVDLNEIGTDIDPSVPRPVGWSDAGSLAPSDPAMAGPALCTGYTTSSSGSGPHYWWQYISMTPPDPVAYSDDASLVSAYQMWYGLGTPQTPPSGPLPSPGNGWWQLTIVSPPDMMMFPDTAAKAAAYRNWFMTH